MTVRVVRGCVAAVFSNSFCPRSTWGLHPVLLQVSPGDIKPVWASRRGAVSRLLTKPRVQRPSAKASRHRTKLRSNRAARRDHTHEVAREEGVDEAAHVGDEGRASAERGARRLLQMYKLVVDIARVELQHKEVKRLTCSAWTYSGPGAFRRSRPRRTYGRPRRRGVVRVASSSSRGGHPSRANTARGQRDGVFGVFLPRKKRSELSVAFRRLHLMG